MDKHHPRMSSRHIWSPAGSGWRQFPTDPTHDSTSYVPCTWGDLQWWISPSWQVKPITNSTFNNSLSFEALKNFSTRVADSVIEGIPNPSRTAVNVLETSLSPVELLDILGFSGHRVVGVSSKHNRMVNYFRNDNLWYISPTRCGPLREKMFTENSDGCFLLKMLTNWLNLTDSRSDESDGKYIYIMSTQFLECLLAPISRV